MISQVPPDEHGLGTRLAVVRCRGEGSEEVRVKLPLGILSLVLGVALTVLLGITLYDAATGDYVGGEVQIVWMVNGFIGVIAALAWGVAFGILKPGPRAPIYWAVLGAVLMGIFLVFTLPALGLLAAPVIGFFLWRLAARHRDDTGAQPQRGTLNSDS